MSLESSHTTTNSPTNSPKSPTHAFDKKKSNDWSVENSAKVYGINNWGNGYFRINQNGNVAITPKGEKGSAVDLYELTQELQDRGIRQLSCLNGSQNGNRKQHSHGRNAETHDHQRHQHFCQSYTGAGCRMTCNFWEHVFH